MSKKDLKRHLPEGHSLECIGCAETKKIKYRAKRRQKIEFKCTSCGKESYKFYVINPAGDCVGNAISSSGEILNLGSNKEVITSINLGHYEDKISRDIDVENLSKSDFGKLLNTDHGVLVKEVVKMSRSIQNLRDRNNVLAKSNREINRLHNLGIELQEKIFENLKSYKFSDKIITWDETNSPGVGVLQLSDLHLNELIIGLNSNSFDWYIASQRLYKFANKAIQSFKAAGFKHIYICFTGDLLNSDRRKDEALSNGTNRTKALWLSIDLLKAMLLHINAAGFNITVSSISGNEGRVNEDIGWIDEIASDNYDFAIHEGLTRLLEGKKGIEFLYSKNPTEVVIEINGMNLLLIHGHNGIASDGNISKKVQSTIGKYASEGIIIRYIIMGHIHQAFGSDMFSRSSGLPGNNKYSHAALNLYGRSSQMLYEFMNDGNINTTKIDLQETSPDAEMYDIEKQMIAYNVKSVDKIKGKGTVIISSNLV